MNLSEWIEPLGLIIVAIGIAYIFYVGRKIKKGRANV